MIVVFNQVYLRDLYQIGKCGDKKHRFQPEIINRYKRCINYLKNASNVEELSLIRSLHYEQLKGDKAGISSIRVNDQYRIEFIISGLNSEVVAYVCEILELSNHYK